jgi:SNF2 family DNA or RNA helicase
MADITYEEFLLDKKPRLYSQGINVNLDDIHPLLFDFQKYITRWALHKGRAALFLDTGLGKTFCQLEWARLLNVPILIVAPLSVARQTVREAKKIDLDIKYIRHKNEMEADKLIHITNYEMVDHVYDNQFQGIVLDESSILKGMDSKTKTKMLKIFKDVPYRLACTATPAPNDFIELGNHTEFLGICKQTEMLAEWFIHANKIEEKIMSNGMVIREKMSNSKGTEWRLRNYGKEHFYEWMTQWAMSMRKPSDLGFNDDGYILPALNIFPHFVKADYKPEGELFFNGLKGLQHRGEIRRSTIDNKLQKALEILNDEQWIIWCGLNDESSQITKLIPGAVEVKGSDSSEYKAEMIEAFQDGKYKVLVTKGKIAGYGMNLQNAHNMMFIGLSDSWEMYYQCIRREYRFGQKNPVNVHIILSDIEREIYNNVQRKEQIAQTLHNELIKNVAMYEINDLKGGHELDMDEYKPIIEMKIPNWINN